MPSRLRRPCRNPSCPKLDCDEHRVIRDVHRASAYDRGYGGAVWRALRRAVLARDPLCKICLRRDAKHADHIVAKKDGGTNAMSNLRGVCASCHSRKTVLEDGGLGRPRPS